MLKDGDGEGHGKLVRNLLDAKNEMERSGGEKEKANEEEETGDGGIILGGAKKGAAASRSPLPMTKLLPRPGSEAGRERSKALLRVARGYSASVKPRGVRLSALGGVVCPG